MSISVHSQPPSDAPVVVIGAGQSGLAAARALAHMDVPAMVLEAVDRRAGSWPRYYDSLRAVLARRVQLDARIAVPRRPGAIPRPSRGG